MLRLEHRRRRAGTPFSCTSSPTSFTPAVCGKGAAEEGRRDLTARRLTVCGDRELSRDNLWNLRTGRQFVSVSSRLKMMAPRPSVQITVMVGFA